MKKVVDKEMIHREYFKEFGFNAGRYLHVVKYNGNYYIIDDDHNYIIAKGKELKGYLGDILYFQYNGEKYGTGDYILNSDRHGMVCKWTNKTCL